MKKFLQLLIALFFISCIISCKKDKEEGASEAPAWFLFSKQMVFSGKVADSTVLWKYGVFEFQRGNGSFNVGSTLPQHRYLTFWLTSNADLTTRFEISTPAYDPNTDALYSDILSIGDKEFGLESEKFGMKLTLDNQLYTTKGNQTNSRLQIFKVENTKDEFNRDMALVWLKANCKFYGSDNTFKFNLTDGYILAGFLYNL